MSSKTFPELFKARIKELRENEAKLTDEEKKRQGEALKEHLEGKPLFGDRRVDDNKTLH